MNSQPEYESLTEKQLPELEALVTKLLDAIKKTPLRTDPVVENLRQMETKLGNERQARFDAMHPTFTR